MRHPVLLVCLFAYSCAATGPVSPGRGIASSLETDGRQIVDSVIARLGPVRNQGNTQLCFAHAVADLVTYHTGKRPSAFSVAVRNFQKRKGWDYSLFNPAAGIASGAQGVSRYMMGLGYSTLETTLNNSLCADDQPEGSLTYRDRDLKALLDSYNYFRSYIGPDEPTDAMKGIELGIARVMPSLSAETFVPNRYRPLDIALGEWFDDKCDIRMPKGLRVKGVKTGIAGSDRLLQAVNAALAIGEPAVVHYDAGVLESLDAAFSQSVIGFHVSLIVAKAEFEGQPHYLLRNSWGSSCYYSPEISRRCDRGHIWLKESEIRSHVTSVTYYSK